MTYEIFDNGNLVAWFKTPEAAQEAFEKIARTEGQPLDTLVLVAVDDSGEVVADCVPGESVLAKV